MVLEVAVLVLHAVFPEMRVSGSGANFRVVGPAMNKAEECASEDLTADTRSNVREVNLSLYDWPNQKGSGLIAVLQYDFRGASPAGSCPSIGLLVHLTKVPSGWLVKERYLFETVHHVDAPEARLLDLTGDGFDELLVESDWGGAGTRVNELHVFDLRRGHFDEILAEYSSIQSDEETYTQKLDVARTRLNRGALFCFIKSSGSGKRVRISTPCYKRGDGLDEHDSVTSTEWLKPITSASK